MPGMLQYSGIRVYLAGQKPIFLTLHNFCYTTSYYVIRQHAMFRLLQENNARKLPDVIRDMKQRKNR